MLKILNKYKKVLIIFSFVYIYILMLLIIPTKYYALTPGEIDNTTDLYNIENVEFNNDINTISVFKWSKISVLQQWLIQNNKKYLISERPKGYTTKVDQLKGKIQLESSHNNAIITAYTHAAKDKSKNISIDYKLNGLTVHNLVSDHLETGDLIIEIDNKKIVSNSYQEFLISASKYNMNNPSEVKSENNYSVKLLRNNKELNLELTKNDYFDYYPNYTINNTTPKYNNSKKQINVGGPSGGAMQAFAIYTALLEIDLSGIKIAGTGTIETNEYYNVGEIGGIVQKFHTVKKAKVDHFIIPDSQYTKIKELDKDLKFKIHPVENFDDIIKLLDFKIKKVAI